MMNSDAKTENTSGRRDKRINQNKQSRLGETGHDSSINGYERKSGSVAGDRTGRDSARTDFEYGDASFGKILQRLDKLEEAHYQYVEAHQNRLRARLDESEQLEQQFRKEAAELRQQILDLAIQEQPTEENS